ncbi:hypothetical protein [Coleofasciculus sp.]|uniref:hypothetical protein n=1 Tax=Coleofasciculus sp. TaxID=3100458 RepID=UPI0039FAB668
MYKLYRLTGKIFIGTVFFIVTFTAFPTAIKPISANDFFPKVLVREDTPSTPTEEISDGQFSTNASDLDLLANPHNEQSNIDFSRYVNIEISERGCDVVFYVARYSASFYYSSFYPNAPAFTMTMFVTTPTGERQTVKLESAESAVPESQKVCNETINVTRKRDSWLHIQIPKPVQQSELELTIQNSWDILKQQD